MAPTPDPIPAGTIALVLRGLDPSSDTDQATMRELAKSTGLTIVALLDGQELEAVSEEEMGRAGWCRCPTPGFPVVDIDELRRQGEPRHELHRGPIEPTAEMVALHGRAMATGMANLTQADLDEPDVPDTREQQAEAGGVPPII
jgi:hypothetical protein